MVRKFTISIVLLFPFLWLHGQQLPQYTQYMFNKIGYNPGYAGMGKGICVGGLIRQQWVGFKETDESGNSVNVAPETYLVSVHSPIRALRGGLGANIIQDKIGHFKDITVNLMYSYHTTVGVGDLGIGAQLSILNKTIDFGAFNPPGGGDGGSGGGTDPLLAQNEQTDMYFDGGIGLYYRVPDNYYIGLSVLQLLQTRKKVNTEAKNMAYQEKRQFNLTGGYEFTFPNMPAIDVLPSFMIKTDLASVQYDLTALLRYKNQFWGGLSYRVQDAVAIILGFEYKDFNIGYSYDITTSAIGGWGSHEIRVGYCFKIEVDKIKKIYRNTRFL